MPADYTSLRIVQLPENGGDTLWASGTSHSLFVFVTKNRNQNYRESMLTQSLLTTRLRPLRPLLSSIPKALRQPNRDLLRRRFPQSRRIRPRKTVLSSPRLTLEHRLAPLSRTSTCANEPRDGMEESLCCRELPKICE